MRQLIAPTEDFIRVEMGRLAADATAGSSVSLTLENNNGFAQNDYIVIGYEGSELAELEQINAAVSGATAVQVATLKFNHKKGEPVVKYLFNKRKFYGSTSIDGSYSELTADGSPKDIQVDDPMGTLLEYTGVEGYEYFKATYYNSQTTTETDADDSDAVAGDQSGRYCTIWGIRKHAGLAGNPFYPDGRIEDKRKQAEGEVNSCIGSIYVLPLSEVPALITNITETLAAGYIDFEEFGKDGEGVKWLAEARALLKAITTGRQQLLGADLIELPRHTKTDAMSGLPNTTDTDAAVFTMADKY